MRKIIEPCGLHCIKINHLGVTMGEQMILDDVNLHIHCGTLTAIIGKNGAGKGMAIAGLITGIASLVCFVVFYVMIAVGIADDGGDFYYNTPYEEFEDDIDDFFDDLSYSTGDAL